jgi:hypothetical protein
MDQYSITADFSYIEKALKAQWKIYEVLRQEFFDFVPRQLSDYDADRKAMLAKLKDLNPDSPADELLKLVDGQIQGRAKPSTQVNFKFLDRVMSLYVTVLFLAHSLSEAAINAHLAIGFSSVGKVERFEEVERGDIKTKWVSALKEIYPTYKLSKSGTLFHSLQHMAKQRNGFIHYKVELEVGGAVRLEGSKIERLSIQDCIGWMERYCSLPYDLCENLRNTTSNHVGVLLYDRGSLPKFSKHLH